MTLERRTSRGLADGLAVAVVLLAVAGGSLIVPAASSGVLPGGPAPPVGASGQDALGAGPPGSGRVDPAGPPRASGGRLE